MNTRVNRSIFNDTGCIRKDQLLRYRDNQMSNAEKHDVEEHLVDCELCSEALEGLTMISNTTVLDSIDGEVSRLTKPSAGVVIRPWLAAATIAGVLLISYITYRQYSELKEERIAQKETVNEEKLSPVFPVTGDVNDSAKNIQEQQPPPTEGTITQEKAPVQDLNFSVAEKEMPAAARVEFDDATAAESVTEQSEKFSDAKVQTGQSTMMESVSAKDVSLSAAGVSNNSNQNITYIDNVKVIDYEDYSKTPATVADVPRSTPSMYQNDKKKSEDSEAEPKAATSMKRKANYIDMVTDPVILFNNGRYESANQGFDELLKRNKNDQNAAFYKGLSLYNLKKCDPALKLLEPLSNDTTSPFMEEAKYYTAKTYICKGNVNKGKLMLEGISNSNGFYSGQAKDDLKNIKP